MGIRAAARQQVGLTAYFPANVPPVGWLKANGATLSRTAYAALWAYAQASGNLAASEGAKQAGQFGPGDGATTFSIPDLRGEFVRGWADNRAVDTGRGIGTAQADDFKSHAHSTATYITTSTGGAMVAGSQYNLSSGTNATGGTETRPRNVALLGCIKH